MGRSNQEVKRLAKLIPAKPFGQSLWKDRVCILYATGVDVPEAVDRATAAVSATFPDFQPQYDSAILDL